MGNPRYRNGFGLTLHWDLIDLPLRWPSGQMILVNSMSDLFHESIPLDFVKSTFETMAKARSSTFQILTKRTRRVLELVGELGWSSNIWIGASVESEDHVSRVADLKSVPAKIRFLSCEPLLGPVHLDLREINWVIVVRWVRSVRDQCAEARVPFFLKQLGGAIDKRSGERAILDGKLWKELPSKVEKQSDLPRLQRYV